jgi:hypothetical protein
MPKLRLKHFDFQSLRSQPYRQVACMVLCLGATLSSADAQTIEQYSRSQRSVIEADMNRNTSRVLRAAQDAQPPAGQASGPMGAPLPPSMTGAGTALAPQMGGAPTRPPEPSVPKNTLSVSGVFVSQNTTLAQVQVGQNIHWLKAGQSVPHTGWSVRTIEPHQVVMSGPKGLRVFKLNQS